MSRPEDRTIIVSPKQPSQAAARSGQRRPSSPHPRQPRRSAIHGGLWLAIAIGCGFGASFALTLRFSRPTFNPVANILQSEQDFPEANFPGTHYRDLEARHGAVNPPSAVDEWSSQPSTAIAPDLPVMPMPSQEFPDAAATDSLSEQPPAWAAPSTESATEPSLVAPTPSPAPEPIAPSAPEPVAPTPTAPPLQ
ncbi:hypothetical protein [Synechococcus elongatus]|uniref:hypothetical protein n=1 Tax=Synechococcus elongatus TaxID=32046 RepID=UPI000F7FA60F|nr:hypothetical protein [Synechococcus elongatus]